MSHLESIINDGTAKAINFYHDIISQKGQIQYVSLEEVFKIHNRAKYEIKQIAKNVTELKGFFLKYPEVFAIKNDSVALKDPSKIETVQLNWVTKFLPTINLEPDAVTLIQFYSEILCKMGPFLEFPIIDLLAYTCEKQEQVKSMPNNSSELKLFLSLYPEVFIINNETVTLTQRAVVEKLYWVRELLIERNHSEINKKLDIAEIYKSVLCTYGANYELPLSEVDKYAAKVSGMDQLLSKDLESLKLLLGSFPELFIVEENSVKLTSSVVNSLHSNSPIQRNEPLIDTITNITKEKSLSISVVCLISRFLASKKCRSYYPFNYLFDLIITNNINTIATNNEELRSFLCNFPEMFNVLKLSVGLTNFHEFHSNQKKWVKEVVGTDKNPSIIEAVYYFSNVMYDKNGGKSVPLHKLLSFRHGLPRDVKGLVKNTEELKNFLSLYPEVFVIVNKDVSLTNLAILEYNQPKWIEDYVLKKLDTEDNLKTSNSGAVSNEKSSIAEFYKSVLCTYGTNYKLPLSEIDKYVAKLDNMDRYVPKDLESLKLLLHRFPQFFIVGENSVKLTSSVVNSLQSSSLIQNNVPLIDANTNITKKKSLEISVVCFISSFIACKKRSSMYPLNYLFDLINASEINTAARNSEELSSLLCKFPKIFNVSGSTVGLTQRFHLNQKRWIKKLIDSDNNHSVIEAVYFFSNIIYGKNGGKSVPLCEVISFRGTAPREVNGLVQNTGKLKNFLRLYPEVFVVVNKDVSLTDLAISKYSQPKWIEDYVFKIIGTENNLETSNNVASNKTDDSGEGTKASGISKPVLCSSEGEFESTEKFAISFYSKYLHRIAKCNNITEIPLIYLFYETKTAPATVNNVLKNPMKLKNFLLCYPNVFKIIRGDTVSLTLEALQKNQHKKVDSVTENASVLTPTLIAKALDSQAIIFLANLISQHKEMSLNKFIKLRGSFPSHLRWVVEDTDRIKNFVTLYSGIFKLLNKEGKIFVELVNSNLEEITKMISEEADNCNDNATVRAIKFYFDHLNNKGKVLSLNRLIGHRGCAPDDVKMVAKNPTELKELFSQFPHIFFLDGPRVALTSFALPKNWRKSLTDISSTKDEEFDKIAVDYFYEILNRCGFCGVLSLKNLYKFKTKSPPIINAVSGKNIQEFQQFLTQHPNYFILTCENVITKQQIPSWSCGKYVDKKFNYPFFIMIFDVLKWYTERKTVFHVDYLYNKVGKFFMYKDKSSVFPTIHDLLIFLALFPNVFYIDRYRISNILASSMTAHFHQMNLRNSKVNEKETSSSANVATNSETESEIPYPISVNALVDELLSPFDVNENEKRKFMYNRKRNPRKKKINVSIAEELDEDACSEIYDESQSSDNVEPWEGPLVNNFSKPGLKAHFLPDTLDRIESKFFSQLVLFESYKNESGSDNYVKNVNSSSKLKTMSFVNQYIDTVEGDYIKATEEAIIVLNNMLWENGRFKILKIEELFNAFQKVPLQINFYCNNINEFKEFLLQFPQEFITSTHYTMAKKNRRDFGNRLVSSNEEEPVSLAVFNFFYYYTKENNKVHANFLYQDVGRCFRNSDGSPIFRFVHEMILFFQMFPNSFRVENYCIINVNAPSGKQFRRGIPESTGYYRRRTDSLMKSGFIAESACLNVDTEAVRQLPTNGESWKDFVLEKTELIEDVDRCEEITSSILEKESIIALDCEGVNLGSLGTLTLIQIGLENGSVYLFDILIDSNMINEGGLKEILESESIIKVLHDSRCDSANLYTEYGVCLKGVFDTRVANHLITTAEMKSKQHQNTLTPIGFNELCRKYRAPINIEKDEIKSMYKTDSRFWKRRPLTRDMLAYAALDVASLVPHVFHSMLKQLNRSDMRQVWDLSEKNSMVFLEKLCT